MKTNLCNQPRHKIAICGRAFGHKDDCGEWREDDREIPRIAGEHDPGDRFSEDTLGADGKAFIAVAMETTKTRCHVAPFSVSIEVEAARSKLTLSFESPNDALVWITNLRNLIAGKLRPVDEDTEQ